MKLIINIFRVLLLFSVCHSAAAAPDNSASQAIKPSDAAVSVLYRYATLRQYGTEQAATDYWDQNKHVLPGVTDSDRDALAQKIFTEATLKYNPKPAFSTQVWLKTQTLSSWMLYLSAFIAVCALFKLLHSYWNFIYSFLSRLFYPLLRIVLSKIAITYELLLIALAGIVFGCFVEDFTLRTVIIHVSLLVIWGQTTSLFTREYLLTGYFRFVVDRIRSRDKWAIFKAVFGPAIITAGCVYYVIFRHPADTFYTYELTFFLLCAFLSLPFSRYGWLAPARPFFPFFKHTKETSRDSRHYISLVIIVWLIAYLLLPHGLSEYFIALSVFAILALNIISLRTLSKDSNINYVYAQLIAIGAFFLLYYKGKSAENATLVWLSVVGLIIYVVIKYWEIPTFWMGTWTKRKMKFGFLGMALLLWLIAKALPYVFS